MTTHPLDAVILEKAARPEGFAIMDARGQPAKNAQKRCNRLVASGELHRVEITRIFVRYFTESKAAAEFRHMEFTKKAKTSAGIAKKAPVKPARPGIQIIMPPDVHIQRFPANYKPLVLADVLRDCAHGPVRQGARAWGGVAA